MVANSNPVEAFCFNIDIVNQAHTALLSTHVDFYAVPSVASFGARDSPSLTEPTTAAFTTLTSK